MALLGDLHGRFTGLIEVMTHFDQLGTQRAHGGILLDRIAKRADDGDGDADAGRAEGDGLPVVAAGGGDDASGQPLFLAARHGDEAAPDLEGTDGRMILMLHPDLAACGFGQQRPSILRRWRHRGIDDAARGFEIFGGKHS
jgi:hypothetical protein